LLFIPLDKHISHQLRRQDSSLFFPFFFFYFYFYFFTFLSWFSCDFFHKLWKGSQQIDSWSLDICWCYAWTVKGAPTRLAAPQVLDSNFFFGSVSTENETIRECKMAPKTNGQRIWFFF
jgi:hypothetical protein